MEDHPLRLISHIQAWSTLENTRVSSLVTKKMINRRPRPCQKIEQMPGKNGGSVIFQLRFILILSSLDTYYCKGLPDLAILVAKLNVNGKSEGWLFLLEI